MRIWVTRSAPDNARTVKNLVALGHDALAAPVLDIRPLSIDVAGERPAGLIFTSRNGVRHHSVSADRLDIPVFTVGDKTADAASALGYRQVWSANGDVVALQRLILDTLPPSRIVHFCGQHSAGDLKGYLGRFGYRVERRPVYAARPVPLRWMLDIRQSLPTIDGIVVHSPRGAERIARLINRADWSGQIWCISKACTLLLDHCRNVEISHAQAPVEAAIMDLIVAGQFRRQIAGGGSGLSFPLNRSRRERRTASANDNIVAVAPSERERQSDDGPPPAA
ncbi:uroporphyrinogen-III synthase [Sphingomonas aestuarii]